jgi:radical SAM protein with 4Fe4S-binding SPASM domain
LNRGLEVQASTVLSQLNKNVIQDLMYFFHDLGVNRASLMNFIPVGRGADNPHLVLKPEDVLEILPKIYEVDREIGDMVFYYPDTPYAYYDRTIGKEAFQFLKLNGRIGSCVAGILAAAVNPQGEVTGCDACQGGVLGNIKEKPFDEIWQNSEGFHHLRTITRDKQIPCKNCEFNMLCLMSCKGLPSQVGPQGNPMMADGYSQRCYQYFHKGELL